MNTEDKYPNLSNADLAELLGLNRLIQFDKLPQRFKDMNTYVPYGHDLIELIQERLRSSGPVILFDSQEEGEEISSREPSKANHCTIDLTYYFSRNADLRATIHATLTRYGVLLDRPLAQAVDEILQKIHDEGLIAKTVPGGSAYHLFVSWDIHNHGQFGDIVGRSLLDDWVITQITPEAQKLTEQTIKLSEGRYLVNKESWGERVTVDEQHYYIYAALKRAQGVPYQVYVNSSNLTIEMYFNTSCGDSPFRVIVTTTVGSVLHTTFKDKLPE